MRFGLNYKILAIANLFSYYSGKATNVKKPMNIKQIFYSDAAYNQGR